MQCLCNSCQPKPPKWPKLQRKDRIVHVSQCLSKLRSTFCPCPPLKNFPHIKGSAKILKTLAERLCYCSEFDSFKMLLIWIFCLFSKNLVLFMLENQEKTSELQTKEEPLLTNQHNT